MAISAGAAKLTTTVGADESRQPFGSRRTEADELVVVDVLGERPAPDLGVQPVVERGEARLAFAADHPDVSERRPHQVAELVGRAEAKRRTERLGRPIADLLSEQLNHRRVARRILDRCPRGHRHAACRSDHSSHLRHRPHAVGEEHHRELTCDTVNFGVADRQFLGSAEADIQGGRESLGDRQHAFVRIYSDDGPCRTHALYCRTRNDTRAGADIEHVIALVGMYRVEHRLDPLAEQRRHKERLVYLRGRR